MSLFSRWRRQEPAPPIVPAVAAIPPAPRKRGPKISDWAVMGLGEDEPKTAADTFRIQDPPPGVLPTGQATMAQDRAVTDLYGYAAQAGLTEGLGFVGYTYLAELAQRPEYRRISETIAKEMTRKWIRFTSNGDEENNDKLGKISAEFRRLKVQDAFRRAAELDGFFGRAHIYPDFEVAEDADLATLLVVDKAVIKKGSLKRLTVVEPMWIYPAGYNSTNPLSKDYYKPTAWYVQGKQVHASRLLTFVSREMPDILKPAYMFGGLSLSQMAIPYVQNWIRTRQSVSDLLHNFSVFGMKGDLTNVLEGGGNEDLIRRAKIFTQMRDNRGLLLIDKDAEDFFNVSAPLGGLDALQAQSQEQLGSVSGIPLVKLLGIQPAGLNASSDGEIRVWYDWVLAQEEHLFGMPLTWLLRVVQLSLFGEIDPDIGFVFEPLWQMSEVERATIRKTNADTAAVYTAAGVLKPDDERNRLADEDGGVYHGLDLSEEPPMAGAPRAQAVTALFDANGITKATMLREMVDAGVLTTITDEDIAEAEKEPPIPSELDTSGLPAPAAPAAAPAPAAAE